MTTNELQVIEKYGDKAINALQSLADKAGQSVDHFYPIFVKQQMIEGSINLSMITFLIVFGMVVLLRNKDVWTDNEVSFKCLVTILGAFSFCIGALLMLLAGANIISQIINPEFAAVKQIMTMIK